MKDTILSERQMQVLRYRKEGLTQQAIAEILGTSKANISTIEKLAYKNIRRAKETLEFYYTLDADRLCTLPSGMDLIHAPRSVYETATEQNIKISYDTISLINRITASVPEKLRNRQIIEDIAVFVTKGGDLYFS